MQTYPSVPSVNQEVSRIPLKPQNGEWLWTCRVGAENDLCEELVSLKVSARPLQPGLVVSSKRPPSDLTFARQGLPVRGIVTAEISTLSAALLPLLRRATALHIFAADSEPGKRLSPLIETMRTQLTAALTAALLPRGVPILADGAAAHAAGGLLAQICLLGPELAVYGVGAANVAPSLYVGGVQRVRRPREAPSRSSHKLVEALAWLGHGPEANEQCIDLGAAPGGWSQVLAERRCQVTAVDLGSLAPSIVRRFPQIRHMRVNGFNYIPDEPADWLFCDMAYRPLEVAALLARWGRSRWARFLIANIKLPMKKRVEMLGRVREILATGGWTGLRVRQLYHDREEVTLFAWRGFGIDTRPPQRRSNGPSAQSPAEPGAKSAAKSGAKSGARSGGKRDARPEARSGGKPETRAGSKRDARPEARSGGRRGGNPVAKSGDRPSSRSGGPKNSRPSTRPSTGPKGRPPTRPGSHPSGRSGGGKSTGLSKRRGSR